MESYELVIEPKTSTAPTRRRRAPAKTRAFRVVYLAHLCANAWWPGGQAAADTTRPVWLMFTASERAARPFVANLQTGHRAALVPYRPNGYSPAPVATLELLKSAGYKFLWQRLVGGAEGPLALVTAYLPDLFVLDPGLIDPTGVRFLALTPTWWAAREAAALAAEPVASTALLAHLRALAGRAGSGAWRAWSQADWLRLVPQAVHAMSYVERRTPRPLVSTPAFMTQIFLAGLETGLWTLAVPAGAGERGPRRDPDLTDRWAWARGGSDSPAVEYQTGAVGLEPPVACRTTHAALDTFLAAEVERYFAVQSTIPTPPT